MESVVQTGTQEDGATAESSDRELNNTPEPDATGAAEARTKHSAIRKYSLLDQVVVLGIQANGE